MRWWLEAFAFLGRISPSHSPAGSGLVRTGGSRVQVPGPGPSLCYPLPGGLGSVPMPPSFALYGSWQEAPLQESSRGSQRARVGWLAQTLHLSLCFH